MTYRQWRDQALRAAAGLAEAGVRPGARVALRFRNDVWERFAVAFLAVQYAGGVPVPVREDLAEPEAARLAALAEAGTVLRDAAGQDGSAVGASSPAPGALPGTVDLVLSDLLTRHQVAPTEPPYRVGPLDEAQVIGTSGTTGAPKGVFAAHGNLTAGLTLNPRPRPYAHSRHALYAFPLGTNAGQVMLLNALTGAPATVILPASTRMNSAVRCGSSGSARSSSSRRWPSSC